MESHTDDVNFEHPGLESPEDFQFDPDCTLILYGLHGRNTKGLLKKFQKFGRVTFWQPVLQYDTAIVAFATPELALEVKNSMTDEKVLFCTVREANFCTCPLGSFLCPFWLHTDDFLPASAPFRKIPPSPLTLCYYRRECVTS